MGTDKRKQKPLERRETPKAFDALVERFYDLETSEPEAYGLLQLLASNHPAILSGAYLERDFGKIVDFLCAIGNAVNSHPSAAQYPGLRRFARIILARHVLRWSPTHVHCSAPDDAKKDSAYATLYRFYAASAEHCWLNESDRDVVREFFSPYGGGRRDAGEPVAFCQALINLRLTDILEERCDLGAIPLLYAELAHTLKRLNLERKENRTPNDLLWRGWDAVQKGTDGSALLKFLYKGMSVERVENQQPEITQLAYDLDACHRRAGLLISPILFQIRANSASLEDDLACARALLTLTGVMRHVYYEAQRMELERTRKGAEVA